MGWRYQIQYLTSLGLKVIVPDMLGYGQTSAPSSVSEYAMKNMADHMAALIRLEATTPGSSEPKVILGGHDWGAQLAWRVAMWHPGLIRAIFTLCVPFMPPSPEVVDVNALLERMPGFRYQLYLASGAVEDALGGSSPDPKKLSAFLHGNFGGTTPEGEPVFSAEKGIDVDRMARVQDSPLVDAESVEYYVRQYMHNSGEGSGRNPLAGPCNWYRTHEINSRDEVPIAGDFAPGRFRFGIPAMIVMAENDPVLGPELAEGQEVFFAAGLKKEVVAGSSHWIMVHKPEETNKHVGDFIRSVLAAE